MGNKAMLAGAVAALAMTGAADAQRVVQHGPGAGYPPPGPMAHYPPLPQPPVQPAGRWGTKVGGRWWGGANAPGGWAAYRAPHRGWRLPGYWVTPRFYISDWNAYGLQPPPAGYSWSRYYDDAVLIDGRGDVYDSVGGLDWDGAYPPRGETAYALESSGDSRLVPDMAYGAPHPDGGYAAAPPPPRENRYERRVYDHGPGPGYPPPPPPEGRSWVSHDGGTTVTVTTAGGAGYPPPPVIYAPPAAYGYGGSVTTVTVQTQPMVTTTTTEIVEDSVTYTRPVVRRVWRKPVWHKRVWRPRPHPAPRCVCGS